jgi:Tfp pilus assembly pilus retraction ATPase PilT
MAYAMNQLLEAMLENGASDLHIRVGRSPSLRVNGGRVAASEIMIRTDGIAAKIREGKTYQLLTDIETGGARGMRTLDSDLLSLFSQGLVTEEEVFNYCLNPEAMRERMRGGASSR